MGLVVVVETAPFRTTNCDCTTAIESRSATVDETLSRVNDDTCPAKDDGGTATTLALFKDDPTDRVSSDTPVSLSANLDSFDASIGDVSDPTTAVR